MRGEIGMRVLIIGGYGVFGARVAKGLVKAGGFEVVVAGRSEAKAEAFCAREGGIALKLDTGQDDLATVFAALRPDIVIDAAGPFQTYGAAGYGIAKAAMSVGAHYLDLSDDADFTRGIGALDVEARAAGVSVLSGASSVPALSSCVVRALAEDMSDIHLIEAAILPGNRAPRGVSVIAAILEQVGRDMMLWRGGQFETVKGWSGVTTYQLDGPARSPFKRRASFIGAPDLALLPDHFKARSVVFRAGLDLGVMHYGLWGLSWLVRLGLMKTLRGLTRPLKWAADLLEPFGSDLGGMVVMVEGQTGADTFEQRKWTLIAAEGDGPNIPSLPAQILCAKLARGEVAVGARACLEVFSLDEAEAALGVFEITTHRSVLPSRMVFAQGLGAGFGALPEPLRDLHTVIDVRRWAGRARIERGTGLLSRFAAWLGGFPPASEDSEVRVEMRRTAEGEVWVRHFGRYRFRSHLSARQRHDGTRLVERFGWMRFRIGLHVSDDELHYPITSGRIFGVPLPRWLLPQSETREYVDAQGRACFDVCIRMPVAGHIVSYSGWLCPAP